MMIPHTVLLTKYSRQTSLRSPPNTLDTRQSSPFDVDIWFQDLLSPAIKNQLKEPKAPKGRNALAFIALHWFFIA